MEVIKIDIKKEKLDMPKGRDRMDFVERGKLSAISSIKEGAELSVDMVDIKKKTYLVHRIKHQDDEPVKNYLVSVDDKELFQDLIMITDDSLNRAVAKKTDWYKELIERKLLEQKWDIQGLPWWKRLFNKF